MSEMISWHKVGQKVAATNPYGWVTDENGEDTFGPAQGEICTINHVACDDGVWFGLSEYINDEFPAENFRPVYPTIIEDLKQLDAPTPVVPVRVREVA